MGEVRQAARGAPNFDRIARLYRWMEYGTLGRRLERTREHFLPRLGECRSALVLGDGDGRFTARMMAIYPEMRVHAVDLSPGMMGLLEARVGRAGARDRLRTTVGDALEFLPERPVDLVVTHFFLDCLVQEEVELLVRRLTPYMMPGGTWLVSEFQVPDGWLRVAARMFVRGLYLAFRVLTGLRVTRVPAYGRVLEEAGLVRVGERRGMGGLLVGEMWVFRLRREGRERGRELQEWAKTRGP